MTILINIYLTSNNPSKYEVRCCNPNNLREKKKKLTNYTYFTFINITILSCLKDNYFATLVKQLMMKLK